MAAALSLIDEVETHLKNGTSEQRAETLRRVTDLFLGGAESYAEEQVALFDDVLSHLVQKIEGEALVRLSRQIAPIDNAPINLIRRLSSDDEIRIAGPVLEQSNRLTDEDLVAIANTKSQGHLGAIAGRRTINPVVTDVLVERGDQDVARKVAGNSGARFSPAGMGRLVERGAADPQLAEYMARRADISEEMFSKLVTRATEKVRERLVADADPAVKQRVQQVLAWISQKVVREAAPASPGHISAGGRALIRPNVDKLRGAVNEAASQGRVQEIADALSALSEVPREIVMRLVRQGPADAVLIVCKASGLGWPVVKNILAAGSVHRSANEAEWKSLFEKFLKLSADAAQRSVRFLRARKALSDADLHKMIDEPER